MRLLRLRIKNLNSFRSETELDFERKPLNGTSLIAITGPTGAGKTTLLDALCVALYNKTPRLLGGKRNKNPGNLLSQGKTEGFAEALFEAKGNRYLAEWRIKRNSKGELKPEVKLIEANTENVITDRLSSRGESHDTSEMSVSKVIESILGLDFNAFNRSVMLAQGDFAAFLRAKPEERRGILEATTGIGVYDQLKHVLNRKVDETEWTYNPLERDFEAITFVTDEEMEKARNDLEEQEVKTQSLQRERAKILEEKKIEEERERLFNQLTQAEIRQGQLLNQQKEINLQQSELEFAHRAAKLVPEQTKFRDEKKDLETIQGNFGKANDSLEFARKDYDEARRNFAEINEAHLDLRSDSDARIKAYRAASDEEARAKAQLETVKGRTAELETIGKRIDELLKTAAFQDKERAALEKDIEEDSSFLQESSLPEDSNQCLNQANIVLQKRNWKSEFWNEKLKTGKELQSKITDLVDELAKSEEERQRRIKQTQVADARLTQAESALEAQQNKGTVETWQAQKHQASEHQSIAIKFEENQRQLSDERGQLRKVSDSLNSAQEAFATLDQQFAIQTEVVGRVEEKVKRCTSEKDRARMLSHITDLRGQLDDDLPCPVCGAMEHPWREKKEDEREKQFQIALSSLSEAEKELETEKKQLQDLEQEQIRVEENQSNAKEQLDESHKKVESLEEIRDSMQMNWKETYPQNEISSKWLQQKIEAADESIRRLQEAHEASKDQKLSADRLKEQEREIQRVKTELDDAESQEQTVNTEVEGLSDEIEALDTDFWEALPDDFREEDQGEALNQFEARIEEVQARKERLNEGQNRLSLLELEIEQNSKDQNANRERQADVVAEIERCRAEANQLSELARAKTGGLTAEAASNKLEREVAEKTELREKSQKVSHEKENELTQAQTKADNLESQHAARVNKLDAAQRSYFEALENGDFESPEAHEEAFRDEAWIKGCEVRIAEYIQDLRTVGEEVARLRPNFADRPFDPEIVTRLQEGEGGINEEIESSSQQVWELQANIKKLEEDIQQRNAQKGALEKALQEKNRWANLQNCIPHNSLRDFALERMFDSIIRFANHQLQDLTQRYELRVEGIDDMVVIDRWNGNEERPVETLSGGEAFLTSLSLALALSEMSRGRTQLNSLYLDEGFGKLDSQTLDIAISALEGLRLAGRTVVVISHIAELTRRIPVRIAVDKMGSGSSRVRIRG